MKVLNIETQISEPEAASRQILLLALTLAKEAGYTHVRDHWGYHYKFGEAFDEYELDEYIDRQKIIINDAPLRNDYKNLSDDLPF